MASLGPRAIVEAIMDLGRVRCRANSAQCDQCPLSENCLAHKNDRALLYGRPAKSSPTTLSLKLLRVVVKQQGKVLAYPKREGEWLAGQWELPTFVLHCEDEKLSQYPHSEAPVSLTTLPHITTYITRYRIHNHIFSCQPEYFHQTFPSPPAWEFYDPNQEPCLLSNTTLKIIDKIGDFLPQ